MMEVSKLKEFVMAVFVDVLPRGSYKEVEESTGIYGQSVGGAGPACSSEWMVWNFVGLGVSGLLVGWVDVHVADGRVSCRVEGEAIVWNYLDVGFDPEVVSAEWVDFWVSNVRYEDDTDL